MKKQLFLSLAVLLSMGFVAHAGEAIIVNQWPEHQGYHSQTVTQDHAAAIGYTPDVLTKETPAAIGYTPDVLNKETPAAIGYTPDVLTKETPAGIGYTPDVLNKETPAGVGYTPEYLGQQSTSNRTDVLYPDKVYSDEVRISVPDSEFERINRENMIYSIPSVK